MLPLIKRILLFSILLCLATYLSAQAEDSVVYSEQDSVQDVKLENLEKQLRSVNFLLRKNDLEQQQVSDSLKTANIELESKVQLLNTESVFVKEKLAQTFRELEQNKNKLEESKKVFKTIYFVTVPIVFLFVLSAFIVLLVLLSRYKTSTNAKFIALRKYTYEGIQEVRADYLHEIKRRVKKIAGKLKVKSKKEKGKSKK